MPWTRFSLPRSGAPAWLPVIVLLFCFCANAARAQSIWGTVRDDVSGQPVAGTAIFLTDMQGVVRSVTRTTADEKFQL